LAPYRILRILNRLNLGGPTHNVAILSRYLQPKYETRVITGVKEESEASSDFILMEQSVPVEVISDMRRAIHPLYDWRAYRAICRAIKNFQPHIVHTHAAKAGFLGRLAAHRMGVPAIVHTFHGHVFHSYFSPLKTQFFIQLERQAARWSDAIVAISPLQLAELTEKYRIAPPEKFHLVPNGYDFSAFQTDTIAKRLAFRKQFGLPADWFVVGIIGRLVPIKNHSLFLQIWKRYCSLQSRPSVALIIGDGELKAALMQAAQTLGLTVIDALNHPLSQPLSPNAVLFTSWYSPIDVALAGLDAVCLTSLNEGTPVSLIEAQAAGVPVLSTRVGGVSDCVNDQSHEKPSGFVFDLDQVEAYAQAIYKLAQNPALANQLGENGKQMTQERFHYSRLVTEMDALYSRLLNK
jgi:glycosyltransferase involved in cell wall biosynthesis